MHAPHTCTHRTHAGTSAALFLLLLQLLRQIPLLLLLETVVIVVVFVVVVAAVVGIVQAAVTGTDCYSASDGDFLAFLVAGILAGGSAPGASGQDPRLDQKNRIPVPSLGLEYGFLAPGAWSLAGSRLQVSRTKRPRGIQSPGPRPQLGQASAPK